MNSCYYDDRATTLYVGDALEVMATLPSASVDCVVTSPPQWGLRDYGTANWVGGDSQCRHTLGTTPHQRRTAKSSKKGGVPGDATCRRCGATSTDKQYGLEGTLEEYIENLRKIAAEAWRLLCPDGTFWLNLRDNYSYQSNGTGRHQDDSNGDPSDRVRHKSLMGIPWRTALRLQEDGWIIRNAIIWHKPNSIPDPAHDRYSSCYEMLFFLVKQPDYHVERQSILEPRSEERPAHRKERRGANKPNSIKTPWRERSIGKNLGDLWSIPTRPIPERHVAPFPIDLPLRCIAVGSRPAGKVLDPFSGSGTTGLAARQLGRRFQGIDLRRDYHDLALRRLTTETDPSPAA